MSIYNKKKDTKTVSKKEVRKMEYVRMTLRLNRKMNEELTELAKKNSVSKNAMINFIVKEKLDFLKREFIKK